MGYRQYCGLARSLDLVGDRWTMLIIRELLAGRSRYGELRRGLPGIPTNLLADRLRRLESDGIVEHNGAGYSLTARGRALRPVVRELIRWAEPLMVEGPGGDHFDGTWLVVALDALLEPAGAGRVELRTGGAVLHVVVDHHGDMTVGAGPIVGADAVITADGQFVLGMATGHLAVEAAVARGLASIDGDVSVVRSVLRATRSTTP